MLCLPHLCVQNGEQILFLPKLLLAPFSQKTLLCWQTAVIIQVIAVKILVMILIHRQSHIFASQIKRRLCICPFTLPCIQQAMSKRSEDFVYFQSKAQHYHNLKMAHPKVVDHLPPSINATLTHNSLQKYNRDLPASKRYDIDTENKSMTNRLVIIRNTTRNQIGVDGGYTRFNKFQRKFRLKNPFRVEQEREIQRKNDILTRKLAKARAKVGNHSAWAEDFQEMDSFRKRICRYDEDRGSKEDIKFDRDLFLPEAYRNFIEQVDNSRVARKSATLQVLQTSRGKSNGVRIEKEKLFILPSFVHHPNNMMRQQASKQSLLAASSQSGNKSTQKTKVKVQAKGQTKDSKLETTVESGLV